MSDPLDIKNWKTDLRNIKNLHSVHLFYINKISSLTFRLHWCHRNFPINFFSKLATREAFQKFIKQTLSKNFKIIGVLLKFFFHCFNHRSKIWLILYYILYELRMNGSLNLTPQRHFVHFGDFFKDLANLSKIKRTSFWAKSGKKCQNFCWFCQKSKIVRISKIAIFKKIAKI